jgi:anti-sigma factor (TIGR02949 family)
MPRNLYLPADPRGIAAWMTVWEGSSKRPTAALAAGTSKPGAAEFPVDPRTCEDAFRRLDDFLDRRLNLEETELIEEHLRVCEACTREFIFEASVLDGVKRKLRQVASPPHLVTRVLRGLSGTGEGEN